MRSSALQTGLLALQVCEQVEALPVGPTTMSVSQACAVGSGSTSECAQKCVDTYESCAGMAASADVSTWANMNPTNALTTLCSSECKTARDAWSAASCGAYATTLISSFSQGASTESCSVLSIASTSGGINTLVGTTSGQTQAVSAAQSSAQGGTTSGQTQTVSVAQASAQFSQLMAAASPNEKATCKAGWEQYFMTCYGYTPTTVVGNPEGSPSQLALMCSPACRNDAIPALRAACPYETDHAADTITSAEQNQLGDAECAFVSAVDPESTATAAATSQATTTGTGVGGATGFVTVLTAAALVGGLLF